MVEYALARIAVSEVPYAADKLYTYFVPEAFRETICPGMRVMIPFGRGNRRSEGFVMEKTFGEVLPSYKPIDSVLDDAPLMSEELLKLVKWMKARYFCTYYDAIKAVLPGGIWLRYREFYRLSSDVDAARMLESLEEGSAEETVIRTLFTADRLEYAALRKLHGGVTEKMLKALVEQGILKKEVTASQQVNDKVLRMVSLALSTEEAIAAVEKKKRSSPVRYSVVKLLATEGTMSATELSYYTGAGIKTLRSMEKAGLIVFSEQEVLRVANYQTVANASPIVLNDEQQAAFDGLKTLMECGVGKAALLHGVTASGKTQVYLRLIQQTIEDGKNAMILVPEIALTPQMLRKFTAYFGNQVAMLHSGLRLTERYDQWKRISRGEVSVVLGTRSAVFAPISNLGIIIIDEEQEPTYCSENPPRYKTQDIAQFRCAQQNALLLLGSATPTIETAYHAREGRYQVFPLNRRYNKKSLPRTLIADMRQELKEGNGSIISSVLREELKKNLERGEQSILFLNRRGNSRMLLCGECGAVPECPRCSVPMTYHSANGRLMCHYCNHSKPAFDRCPDCGGMMKYVGCGTQKAEEELSALFPGKKILRMDTDTVSAAHGHEAIFKKFEEENIPILLGTQMVAKGLDFENVTLVGVLDADLSLYVDNFHAAERTFDLLSQVVGRAGRGSKQGRAVIQTYTPENIVIKSAAAQDYEAFYQSELRMRRLRRYPPFADLFVFTVSGTDESRVFSAANALKNGLNAAVLRPDLRTLSLEVLGPAGAPIIKVNNRYRYRVYIAGKNCAELRKLVAEFLLAFHRHKENRGLDIFADCNALQ
ncbi:MAG: primosomal protein N' [Eubacteriales bacterium]|nr:primosomal protein N' [Eubacteriales bacterium]